MTGIAPGVPWGEPESGPPDLTVTGGDVDLAAAVRAAPPGVLVRFVPNATSDVARAVGLREGAAPLGLALALDALEIAVDGGPVDRLAVNMVVIGRPPDRLTALHRITDVAIGLDGRPGDAAFTRAAAVVIATGQWLRGADLVPRGHPGDGRAEVQAYALRPGQRRAMRLRLPTGTHLPHSGIVGRTARDVEVRLVRPLPLEVDGEPAGRVTSLHATLVPARYRLLV